MDLFLWWNKLVEVRGERAKLGATERRRSVLAGAAGGAQGRMAVPGQGCETFT